jgi:pimeloyl-ACP methyl ester carboxylesterase
MTSDESACELVYVAQGFRRELAARWMTAAGGVRVFVCAVALVGAFGGLRAAEFDVLKVPGVTLRGNPLGDPEERRVAVFAPGGTKADAPMAMVIYLPGWGGSSEDVIAQGAGAWFGSVLDQLAADGLPLRLAIVDGRSRYGGSQFLNSTATGNYADYVADEILPALKARYTFPSGPISCLLAGHSSGAYGALMLAMRRPALFAAVVAMSPDSDFETTHKPLVTQPSVRAITRADLDAAMAPAGAFHLPADELAGLVMGLCANYAPIAGQPGRFEWLYDDGGKWRAEAWQRWLDLDPLNVVRRRADAFAPGQRIYLDGAALDEFGANIGARKIYDVLKERSSPAAFYEPPDHHEDHLPERLTRGLSWVFGKPAPDIAPAK